MKKKALSLALALVMCLGLLPVTSLAAETSLPDWYFLFAIFKNVDADCRDRDGVTQHTKYTMTQDEIDSTRSDAQDFEAFMNSAGVIRAHVDVVEIDTPITELENGENGGFLAVDQAAPLLKSVVDLDQYDHITCVYSLNVHTYYYGQGGSWYENGSGHSGINLVNRDYCLNVLNTRTNRSPAGVYVHEFLHFMEGLTRRYGTEFGLHDINNNFYSTDTDDGRRCQLDIMRNQAVGDAGTGVPPAAWQCPPRVFRTISDLTVPSSIPKLGSYAYQNSLNLTKVTIPGNVVEIGKYAFFNCTNLTEVTMLPGVTSIGNWAYGCETPSALEKVTIPGSVADIGNYAFYNCANLTEVVLSPGVTNIGTWAFSCENTSTLAKITIPASVSTIGRAAFWKTSLTDVYYEGTEAQWNAISIDEYNQPLTNATIHYNSSAASAAPAVPAYEVSDWAKDRVAVAVESGLAADSLGNDYRVNITRAQFAATAVKLYEAMSGKPAQATGASSFTDTTDPVILQAADLGFVSGVGGGKFSPDALVTREQAAVMLSSVYTKLGGKVPAVTSTPFADDGDVASWARNAVAFMSAKEIVTGVGNNKFSPAGNASIEQALLIALKMFETLK